MDIKKETQKGEKELENAKVPPSGKEGDKSFKLEDIDNKFKDIYIQKPFISLVGSTAIHGEGRDVDLVVEGGDLPPEYKTAIDFRLFRQMAAEFDIPYEDTPEYLGIHYKKGKPFTSYKPLYALKLERIDDADIIEMNLRGNFDVIKKSKDSERIIAGYASLAIVDDESQYIPVEVLRNGLKTLLKDESYANLMVVHKNIQVGKILKDYKDLKTHVDNRGLYVVAKIRDDLEAASNLWQQILDGDMSGFSIAGEILESHDECDEESCVEVIDRINLFEISVCNSPVVKGAGFKIVKKSDVSNECVKCRDKMAKDKELEKDTSESEEEVDIEEKSEDEQVDEEVVEKEEPEEEETTEKEEETTEENEEEKELPSGKQQQIADAVGMLAEVLDASADDIWNAIDGIMNKEEKDEVIQENNTEEEKSEEENLTEKIESILDEKLEDLKDNQVGGLIGAIKEKLDEILKGEEVSEEDLEELKSMVDNLSGKGKYPYPYPYPTKYPYPGKSEDEEVEKAEEEPEEEESETEEEQIEKSDIEEVDESREELKLALKARDDSIDDFKEKIKNLEQKVTELEEKEETPSTVTKEREYSTDPDIKITRQGTVYRED